MSLLTLLMVTDLLTVDTCCACAVQACQSKLQVKSQRALPYYLRSATAFVRTPTLSAATPQVTYARVILFVMDCFSNDVACMTGFFICPILLCYILGTT